MNVFVFRQCLYCGVAMVEKDEMVPCPDNLPGCCVAHYAKTVRCPKCGRAEYQKLIVDGRETS